MPDPPPDTAKGADAEYRRSFNVVKQEIYNSIWKFDYYLLKASKSAEEYFFMMNKIEIKELPILIIKAYLEKQNV